MKASYIERKNYVKYDETHYLLYLNEEPAEVTNEETGESVAGYAYTGTMPDGGTLVVAADVTDENRRARFVAGLIGTKYDINDQIALLANGDNTRQHAEELATFEAVRTAAKAQVDELLARTL